MMDRPPSDTTKTHEMIPGTLIRMKHHPHVETKTPIKTAPSLPDIRPEGSRTLASFLTSLPAGSRRTAGHVQRRPVRHCTEGSHGARPERMKQTADAPGRTHHSHTPSSQASIIATTTVPITTSRPRHMTRPSHEPRHPGCGRRCRQTVATRGDARAQASTPETPHLARRRDGNAGTRHVARRESHSRTRRCPATRQSPRTSTGRPRHLDTAPDAGDGAGEPRYEGACASR